MFTRKSTNLCKILLMQILAAVKRPGGRRSDSEVQDMAPFSLPLLSTPKDSRDLVFVG